MCLQLFASLSKLHSCMEGIVEFLCMYIDSLLQQPFGWVPTLLSTI